MGRYRPNDRYDRDPLCSDNVWQELYGSSMEGNLPQHIKNHIGNCWKPCPYSTQAVIVLSDFDLAYQAHYGAIDVNQYIKAMLSTDVVPALVDHTLPNGKVVYLKYAYRGVWGFECTFPGCTFFIENNKRYFYV